MYTGHTIEYYILTDDILNESTMKEKKHTKFVEGCCTKKRIKRTVQRRQGRPQGWGEGRKGQSLLHSNFFLNIK